MKPLRGHVGAVLLRFLFLLLRLASSSELDIIPVSNSNVLQQYLCGTDDQQIPNNTVLELTTSYYELYVSRLCLISNRHNIGIISNLENNPFIACHNPTGLGFVNVNTLTIKNVVLQQCDADILPLANRIGVTAGPYISNASYAALAIVDSSAVSLSNVTILNYNRYAILAINVYGRSVLDNLTIYGQYRNPVKPGSGVMVYYNGNGTASLRVANSQFLNILPSYSCFLDSLSPLLHGTPIPTPHGVVSVVYNQVSQNVSVTLLNCNITQSNGSPLVLILYFDSLPGVTTVIDRTLISANQAEPPYCEGNGLAMVTYFSTSFTMRYNKFAMTNHWTSLRVLNTTITNNIGPKSVIYLSSSQIDGLLVHVHFQNVDLVHNSEGKVLYAETLLSFDDESKSLVVHFVDVKAQGNRHIPVSKEYFCMPSRAIMTLAYVAAIYISDSSFTDNIGSVIEALDTDVYMSGKIVFGYNSGSSGAALVLFHESYLFLYPNLSARFEYNSYKYGGAIYSFNDKTDNHTCTFQVLSSNFSEVTEIGPRFFFQDNIASIGLATVSSMSAYDCQQKLLDIKPTNMFQLYRIIFQNVIVIKPIRIVPCVEREPQQDYTNVSSIFYTFPGKLLNFSLAAITGDFKTDGTNVATPVQVQLYHGQNYRNLQPSSWWLSDFESKQMFRGASVCNNFSLTIHTNKTDNSSHDINSTSTAFFSFSDTTLSTFQATIVLKPCPPGFQLNKTIGVCECSSLIKTMNQEFGLDLICDIQNTMIKVPNSETWIGCYNYSEHHCEVVGISLSCFPGLCNYAAASHQWISGSASICIDTREDALCSSCAHGYSVVFGSNQCQQCSNWWLFTIPLYAIAGLLLVVFIFIFKFTVSTGTLNGIIFFGNMWNSGPLEILTHHHQNAWATASSSFISFLNLGLVYPLCFYDGMKEMAKSWLQLLFPVYLLALVALVVIVSRYSMRVSRLVYSSAVPVLVTVVHLSLSGIFLALIDAFSVGYIYTTNNNHPEIVWLRDGNVPYFSPQHIALMIVSSVLAAVFTIPYLFLLIGARWWIKFKTINLYFKPIIDAAHGPYKDNMHYWFSLRLILLLQQMVVYAALRGEQGWILYSVNGPILIAFTILHISARPFKSKAVNILDGLMMLAICLVVYACSALYYQYSVSVITLSTIVTLAFLVFITIIGYHILLAIFTYCRSKSQSAERAFQYLSSLVDYDTKVSYQPVNNESEFREPLLDMN